jgi:2-dehydro-3-deoxygluconokinase
MMDVVTVGETMALVRILELGKLENQSTCTLGVGGAESNVAIGLARLGHRVGWISALGQDVQGDLVEDVLRSEGVEVFATRSPNKPTGLMLKSLSTGSERLVTYYRSGSAASFLAPEDFNLSLFQDSKILHVSGIMPSLSQSTREATSHIMSLARDAGITVSLDLNYRAALWSKPEAAVVLKNLLPLADIIFGDSLEFTLLLDEQFDSSDELLVEVAKLGCDHLVLKQGEAGATAFVDGLMWQQEAYKVEAVDTVGAGDAFVAGYLSALLDEESIQKRLERATICGAFACLNAGDWEGAATREQVEASSKELSR